MEKSKASWRFRRALKTRSRKWRRRQVLGFYFLMSAFVLTSAGQDHRSLRHSWVAFYTLFVLFQSVFWRFGKAEPLVITSLDDRAQLAHGMNFEQLSPAEQHELLRRHRVGGSVKFEVPDERQEALRLKASESAFRFLRVALLWFVAVYWALYFWLPAGDWRDMLTDGPVMISWLAVFVISLPQIIVMWTEPDELGETRLLKTPAPQH